MAVQSATFGLLKDFDSRSLRFLIHCNGFANCCVKVCYVSVYG